MFEKVSRLLKHDSKFFFPSHFTLLMLRVRGNIISPSNMFDALPWSQYMEFTEFSPGIKKQLCRLLLLFFQYGLNNVYSSKHGILYLFELKAIVVTFNFIVDNLEQQVTKVVSKNIILCN